MKRNNHSLVIPVYRIVTGARVDNIPQWLLDVEGTDVIRAGTNIDHKYKVQCFYVDQYTFHFIVYDRSTYNHSSYNNNASIIGRYDYTYKSEEPGAEYIILYN